eukprot:1355316-Rhodomonas_salina.2
MRTVRQRRACWSRSSAPRPHSRRRGRSGWSGERSQSSHPGRWRCRQPQTQVASLQSSRASRASAPRSPVFPSQPHHDHVRT